MIQVKQFFAHNELRNFSYLLYNDKSGSAWVIDPYEAGPLKDYIKRNSLRLQGILNTHQHFDHIRGNIPLIETFHCPVKEVFNSERIVLDQDHILDVMDTPGHTLDHQVFILKEGKEPLALFSGDTLFNAGVGNCKGGGNVDMLYETTMKLVKELPDHTLLYPGHDYAQRNLEFAKTLEPSNSEIDAELKLVLDSNVESRVPIQLKTEKRVNPFLRLDSLELRETLKKQKFLENETEIERNLFKTIRSLRDIW